jgi:hypothetical protein
VHVCHAARFHIRHRRRNLCHSRWLACNFIECGNADSLFFCSLRQKLSVACLHIAGAHFFLDLSSPMRPIPLRRRYSGHSPTQLGTHLALGNRWFNALLRRYGNRRDICNALYLNTFILVIPFIPFLPSSVPAMYFGKVFFGPAALGVYAFNFALISIPGIGLLLLKRWSYPLTIASQLLASINAIFTTSSPSYEASVRAVFEKMNILNFPSNTQQMLHYSRYFNLIGLLIPIAIVVTLFIARGKFYEAANRAAQGSLPTTPTPSV